MAFTKLNSDRKPVLRRVTASGIPCAVHSTTFLLSMLHNCTKLQNQTQENPLQHSKSMGWRLASPSSHIPQLTGTRYLDSNTQLCLIWTIPFSLSGEEYHLQWYLFWTFFWKNIPSLPPTAFLTLFLACGISTCVLSPCLDLNSSSLVEGLGLSWQLWALQLSQCHG